MIYLCQSRSVTSQVLARRETVDGSHVHITQLNIKISPLIETFEIIDVSQKNVTFLRNADFLQTPSTKTYLCQKLFLLS